MADTNPFLNSREAFIDRQVQRHVRGSDDQEAVLRGSIASMINQNQQEFSALVDWFCQCLATLMGDYPAWRKPTVHNSVVGYGDGSDIHYRFDIYFGARWSSQAQLEAFSKKTNVANVPPYDLDTDLTTTVLDGVTVDVIEELAKEVLFRPAAPARLNYFSYHDRGGPVCVYTPNGTMVVGFSVSYRVETLAYVNTGMRQFEGRQPTPLYVLSRIHSQLARSNLDMLLLRAGDLSSSVI